MRERERERESEGAREREREIKRERDTHLPNLPRAQILKATGLSVATEKFLKEAPKPKPCILLEEGGGFWRPQTPNPKPPNPKP